MKRAVLIVVILATLVCVGQVWAQRGPGEPGGPGGPRGGSVVMAVLPPPAGMADQIAVALELDTDTAAALKAALTAGETAIQPLQKAAADAAKAVRDALTAETFDASAVAALAATAQDAEADVIAASLDVWTRIRTILTAEQAAKLQMGHGPGGPPPPGGGPGGAPSGRKGR